MFKISSSTPSITMQGMPTKGGTGVGGKGNGMAMPPVTQGMSATMVLTGHANVPVYIDHESIKKSLMHQEQKSIS